MLMHIYLLSVWTQVFLSLSLFFLPQYIVISHYHLCLKCHMPLASKKKKFVPLCWAEEQSAGAASVQKLITSRILQLKHHMIITVVYLPV